MPDPSAPTRNRAPRRHPVLVAAALALTAIVIPLAACGSENSVDQESLESGILDLAPPSAQAESASCPDDVSSDTGTEFECTVTAGGGEVQVVATIVSEGEDDVRFEIKSVDGEPVP